MPERPAGQYRDGFGKAEATCKEETVETTLIISALKVVGYGLGAIGPGIGIGIAA